MHHDTHVTDATPEQVHLAANGEILLVDVREPNEYAFERIHGALLYPLSTFDAGRCRPRAASWYCTAARASAR